MRPAAWTLLVWTALIGAWTAMLWIWWDEPIAVGLFGAATGVMLGLSLAIALRARREPDAAAADPAQDLRAIPDWSLGTVALALGLAAALYGAVFGIFLVLIGGGIAAAGLGRVLVERRGERTASARARARERRR